MKEPHIPEAFFNGISALCIDASSIIYLLKIGLLGSLAAEVHLVSPAQVIAEVGWPHLPVISNIMDEEGISNDESLLFLARREGLPLLSEDKEILENARDEGMDHYNTLMMLNYLLLKNRINLEEYPEYLVRLKDCSHYSQAVLDYGAAVHSQILISLT